MQLWKSVRLLNNINPSRLRHIQPAVKLFSSKTHFGFHEVDETEKQKLVDNVFHNVASKYDLMNDVMSCGIHRLWKDAFVRHIRPSDDLKCLDVAGGTVDWIEGNAEALPFEDNTFDLYTIAFGIRNCTHLDKVLTEALRVLRPYGRFYCLEFSQVNNFLFRNLYDWYSLNMIPVMGQLVAGDWNSYQYLVESIRRFPNQADFSAMIESNGFSHVNRVEYTGGIASVYRGFKLPS